MLTVGIDLGTSTTQLVLSELTIENYASAFSVP
ncbi:ethanolamine ammonia-lyase reactivating factor EutA, partial [Parabacteroides distasonis]|nr:ethanolamine ammonia-lyase reactivating factor EutA [Parabacteroides distasonis]